MGQNFAKTFVQFDDPLQNTFERNITDDHLAKVVNKQDKNENTNSFTNLKNFHTSANNKSSNTPRLTRTKEQDKLLKRWAWWNSILNEAKGTRSPKTSPKLPENIDSSSAQQIEEEVLEFMRGVMDECTYLGNFSVPVDPSLVIVIVARDDGYIPRDNVTSIRDLWPAAEIRELDTGHITAFLTKQAEFR